MNRTLRLGFAAVLTLALAAAGLASPVRADDDALERTLTTPQLVRMASRSIVRIDVEGPTVENVPTGQRPGAKTQKADGYGISTGTGFVIDEAGLVVTNNHVVHPHGLPFEGQPRMTVELPSDFNPRPTSFKNKAEKDAYAQIVVRNGRSYIVNPPVIGCDEEADLAVVQIPAGLLPALKFARPESIEVGEDVVAIGFALSLPGKPSVTKGVVSAVGRSYSEAGTDGPGIEAGDLIQTDAAVNHGNSGGPLLDMQGEVVGVNTYTLADPKNPQTQGMYLARSSRTAARYVEAMIEKGRVARGVLGADLRNADLLASRALDIPLGVMVMSVKPGSAAEKAGLHRDDLILRVGGAEVQSIGDLDDALALANTGSKVEVEYRDFQYTIRKLDGDNFAAKLTFAVMSAGEKDAAAKTTNVVLK